MVIQDWFCSACPLVVRLGVPQKPYASLCCPLCGLDMTPTAGWPVSCLRLGMGALEAPVSGDALRNAPPAQRGATGLRDDDDGDALYWYQYDTWLDDDGGAW